MAVNKAKLYARLRDEQFAVFENYARQNGMNSKCLMVFMWIYYSSDALTQEKIAKRTFSTKQVVQAIIKTYRERDMIYLEASCEDKRKKLVKFTEQGRRFAAQLLKPLAEYEDEAMNALSTEQQEALLEGTKLFSEKLNALLAGHKVIKYA